MSSGLNILRYTDYLEMLHKIWLILQEGDFAFVYFREKFRLGIGAMTKNIVDASSDIITKNVIYLQNKLR